jgi:hypothetical protein
MEFERKLDEALKISDEDLRELERMSAEPRPDPRLLPPPRRDRTRVLTFETPEDRDLAVQKLQKVGIWAESDEDNELDLHVAPPFTGIKYRLDQLDLRWRVKGPGYEFEWAEEDDPD